jgi:hypothetical protein
MINAFSNSAKDNEQLTREDESSRVTMTNISLSSKNTIGLVQDKWNAFSSSRAPSKKSNSCCSSGPTIAQDF